MSKSARALVQLGIALVLAIAGGALMFMWASNVNKKTTPTTTKAKTVSVIVAKADLSRGTKLMEDMLQIREFTPDSRPAGTFPTVESIEGRVLNVAIGMNEAITTSKLADPSVMGGGISALIEPGKRAMSVKGNKVMGLSGFVRPGDHVDVIVSLPEGNHETPETKLVLERVKVLATGTQLSAPDEKGQTASVDIYTLELTPAESERLALAATQGTLNFALRNEQDTEKVLTSGSTIRNTLAVLRPKPKPRKRSQRKKLKVEVITGGDTKTLRF